MFACMQIFLSSHPVFVLEQKHVIITLPPFAQSLISPNCRIFLVVPIYTTRDNNKDARSASNGVERWQQKENNSEKLSCFDLNQLVSGEL